MAGSPLSSADCASASASASRGGLGGGRKGLTRRAQRLGQPARSDQEVFGGLRHLRLLERADALRRRVALGFTERFHDAALGDAAEIVLDRRPPADRRHVESDRLGQMIRVGDRLRAAIIGLGHGIDGQGDAVGKQALAAVVVERYERVPQRARLLRELRRPGRMAGVDRLC